MPADSNPAPYIEVQDSRNHKFFMVDNTIMDDYAPLIGPYATALYMALVRRAKNGQCFPSYSALAEMIGASRSMTIRATKALQLAGLITVETRKTDRTDNDTNLFTLCPLAPLTPETRAQIKADLAWLEDRSKGKSDTPPSVHGELGSVRGTPPLVYDVYPGGVPRTPKQDSLNKTNRNKTLTSVSAPLAPAATAPVEIELVETAQPEQATFLQASQEKQKAIAPPVPKITRGAYKETPAYQAYTAAYPKAALKLSPALRKLLDDTIGTDEDRIKCFRSALVYWQARRCDPSNLPDLFDRTDRYFDGLKGKGNAENQGYGLGNRAEAGTSALERRNQERYTRGWVTGADLAAYFGDSAPAAD